MKIVFLLDFVVNFALSNDLTCERNRYFSTKKNSDKKLSKNQNCLVEVSPGIPNVWTLGELFAWTIVRCPALFQRTCQYIIKYLMIRSLLWTLLWSWGSLTISSMGRKEGGRRRARTLCPSPAHCCYLLCFLLLIPPPHSTVQSTVSSFHTLSRSV